MQITKNYLCTSLNENFFYKTWLFYVEYNADTLLLWKYRYWKFFQFFYCEVFFIIWKGDVPPKVQVFHFQPWKSTAIVSVIYPEGKSEEKLGINIYGTAFIIINLCLHWRLIFQSSLSIQNVCNVPQNGDFLALWL